MTIAHQDKRFDRQVLPHHGALQRFALWLTRDRQVAEDLVQETLLRAWRNLDQLRDAKAVKPWLMTTLRRENARRFERRRLDTVDIEGCTVASDVPAPEDRVFHQQVRKTVSQLPRNYREPLAMQAFMDRSIAEVAKSLGLSSSAVMTRVFRARQQLRQRFEEPMATAA